jgi:hypothetical protein
MEHPAEVDRSRLKRLRLKQRQQQIVFLIEWIFSE